MSQVKPLKNLKIHSWLPPSPWGSCWEITTLGPTSGSDKFAHLGNDSRHLLLKSAHARPVWEPLRSCPLHPSRSLSATLSQEPGGCGRLPKNISHPREEAGRAQGPRALSALSPSTKPSSPANQRACWGPPGAGSGPLLFPLRIAAGEAEVSAAAQMPTSTRTICTQCPRGEPKNRVWTGRPNWGEGVGRV